MTKETTSEHPQTMEDPQVECCGYISRESEQGKTLSSAPWPCGDPAVRVVMGFNCYLLQKPAWMGLCEAHVADHEAWFLTLLREHAEATNASWVLRALDG